MLLYTAVHLNAAVYCSPSQCCCVLQSISMLLYTAVHHNAAVYCSPSQCCCILQSNSMLLYTAVHLNAAVYCSPSQCCCTLQSISMLLYTAVHLNAAVYCSPSQCCCILQSISMLLCTAVYQNDPLQYCCYGNYLPRLNHLIRHLYRVAVLHSVVLYRMATGCANSLFWMLNWFLLFADGRFQFKSFVYFKVV